MSLFFVTQVFSSEEHALAYWMKVRWPKGITCPGCGHMKCNLIENDWKTGKRERPFECADCGPHFRATTRTLFRNTELPLQKRLMAITHVVEKEKGISVNQAARHIGVTYRTAWYLGHRMRHAMQETDVCLPGGKGACVGTDDTMIGRRVAGGGNKGGFGNKIKFRGIVGRRGRVRLQAIAKTKKVTLIPTLDAKLSPNVQEIGPGRAGITLNLQIINQNGGSLSAQQIGAVTHLDQSTAHNYEGVHVGDSITAGSNAIINSRSRLRGVPQSIGASSLLTRGQKPFDLLATPMSAELDAIKATQPAEANEISEAVERAVSPAIKGEKKPFLDLKASNLIEAAKLAAEIAPGIMNALRQLATYIYRLFQIGLSSL